MVTQVQSNDSKPPATVGVDVAQGMVDVFNQRVSPVQIKLTGRKLKGGPCRRKTRDTLKTEQKLSLSQRAILAVSSLQKAGLISLW